MTAQQPEEAIFFVKMKECQVKVNKSKRPYISVYPAIKHSDKNINFEPIGFYVNQWWPLIPFSFAV